MLRKPRGKTSHLDAVLHINSMGLLTIIQKNKCRCYPRVGVHITRWLISSRQGEGNQGSFPGSG